MSTITTDRPTTAPTIVDQQSPTTDARPVEPAVQPQRRATSRRVLGWTATIATIGVAAVLAVTAFGGNHSDTPALNGGGRAATELDVRGIPTWWTNGPTLNDRSGAPTELDVRGIPTWWQ
jgi:hypothetical protein